MFKTLAVVVFMASSGMASAFDSLTMDGKYTTKNVVRAKLWYEGLDQPVAKHEGIEVHEKVVLPEEISIALDMLDS